MEVNKIKFEDLFDGDPFEKARESLLKLIQTLEELKKKNIEIAKIKLIELEKETKSNEQLIKKIEEILKLSKQLAENQKILNETQKKAQKELNELEKKKKELSFEDLVLKEKQKLKQSELIKKAKERAKEELGVSKATEKQIGAYKQLDNQLKTLRTQFKDLAAEAVQLELSGKNPERLAEIKKQLSELQPQITALDTALKQIDANVGQFQRQVGSYKVAIVEAFKEVRGQISENIKGLTGLDERADIVVDAAGQMKDAFNKFGDSLKNNQSKLKGFLDFLKNIGKASVLGVILLALSSIQAVAQGLGGTFNELKDTGAGALESFNAIASKVALFFSGEFKKAFEVSVTEAFKLGKEISKLRREFESLEIAINNTIGNLESSIQSQQAIASNAFKTDKERFAAQEEALRLQISLIEIRTAKLLNQLEIAQKELNLQIATTGIQGKQLELIEKIRTGQLSILDSNDKVRQEFNELPTAVQKALLKIDEITGNLAVEQDELFRAKLEAQTFYAEKLFKELNINLRKTIKKTVSDIDLFLNQLPDNISFKDAIDANQKAFDTLINTFDNVLKPIFKNFGQNIEGLNASFLLTFKTAEDLRKELSERGFGEEVVNELITAWEDVADKTNKYLTNIEAIKKAEQEAIQDGLKRQTLAKEALKLQELQFDLEQARIKQGLPAILEQEKLLFEIRNAQIEKIKKDFEEQLKNKKLTNEQIVALELETQQKINEITQNYELERQRFEQERLQRIKQVNKEIEAIADELTISNIEETIQKNRNFILLSLNQTKKLLLEIQDIRLKQLMITRDEQLLTAKSEEERIAILKKFNLEIEKLQRATSKKLNELNKQALNELIDIGTKSINEAQNLINQNFQKNIQNIDRQLNTLNNAIEKERELANKGVQTNLDALEKQVAQLEARKRTEEKRNQNAQLALAFVNSVASYAKIDPKTAVQNAFKDIILAKALAQVIAGAFKEGVENFQGKGTETSDSNLVLISRGESVITAKATKQYKGLATAMNEGKVEQWINNNYGGGTNINVDELGNLIETKIIGNSKRIIKYLNKRR
jgi:hypothetical protein